MIALPEQSYHWWEVVNGTDVDKSNGNCVVAVVASVHESCPVLQQRRSLIWRTVK